MTNVWDYELFFGAQYPVLEVDWNNLYKINYSAFSNAIFRNSQQVNPSTGLVQSEFDSEVKPIQTICDHSTISLLVRVHANEFLDMNSDLPDDFQQSFSVRTTDCQRLRLYGLQLLRDLDQYQKDCWSFCSATKQVGFRKGLGERLDRLFDNTANASVPPYERNISNVMVRLLTCMSAGWFDENVSDVVHEVIHMCASSEACARLCGGIPNSSDAGQQLENYQALLSFIDSSQEHKLSPDTLQLFVLPISVVASIFTNSMTENSVSSVVAGYIDSLANPETGQCRVYDEAMNSLLTATGGSYSPFADLQPSYSLQKVMAIRNPAYSSCQIAMQTLNSACVQSAVMDLCTRASWPDVTTAGSFDTCGDPGLYTYWNAVSRYNSACGIIGYSPWPTAGPVKSYFWFQNGITMGDCFQGKTPQVVTFFIAFTSLWIIILVYLLYAYKKGERWLATCDFTMDVSRSRAFTVCGTLWLLYFFYQFYNTTLDVNLNSCTESWPECGGAYFPKAIYFAILCFMWIAAFTAIFIANNPYREHGVFLALPGIGVSHYYTLTVAVQCLKDIDLNGNTFSVRSQKFFEISLMCALQAGMDISFMLICIGKGLGWKTFHQIRGEIYSSYISSAMNKRAAPTDHNSCRIVITCAIPQGQVMPCVEAISKDISALLGSADHHVITSIKDSGVPEHRHRVRARRLKFLNTSFRVFSIQVMLLKTKAEKIDFLRAEERKALENGRTEDAVLFRAQYRVQDVRKILQATRRDAILLRDILSYQGFSRNLGRCQVEQHFPSAMSALIDFCLSLGRIDPDRATSQTRLLLIDAIQSFGLSSKQQELLISLPEAELAGIMSQLDSPDLYSQLMLLIEHTYRIANEKLVELLSQEQFLLWLDNSQDSCCKSDRMPTNTGSYESKHPYPVVGSALDAFVLCNSQPQFTVAEQPKVQLGDILSKLVRVVKNRTDRQEKKEHGVFRFAIGVSEKDQTWDTWASGKRGFFRQFLPNYGVAFTPSILFICVGIAVVIVLSTFASQLVFAIQARNTLLQLAQNFQALNFILANMIIGALNVAKCFDSTQVHQLQSMNTTSYFEQIADWEPVLSEVQRLVQNSNLTAFLQNGSSSIEDEQQFVTTLSRIIVSSFPTFLANASSAEALASLPVFGPVFSCISTQVNTLEVQNSVSFAKLSIMSAANTTLVQISSSSNDTCR